MSEPLGPFPPRKAALVGPFIENFVSVANANLAETGLTAGQMTELNDDLTEYTISWGNLIAARHQSEMATTTNKAAMNTVVTKLRELARIVQAHPGASDELKQNLGLPVRDTHPAPVIPQAPLDLNTAVGRQAQITLKWDRAGNKQGTSFIIEYREGDSGPWEFVASVTKSRYVDLGRVPGVYLQYRVRAVRAGRQSLPSEPANVYAPDNLTVQLQLAA